MTTLPAPVTVIDVHGATWDSALGAPAAAVVRSDGADLHRELWPLHVPVLVVLPPYAASSAVVRAFAVGADACVRTASDAEISAHVGALLRRRQHRAAG